MPIVGGKGSRKNNFAELSLRFGPALVDLTERNHKNSGLFRGFRDGRSAEDGLKLEWEDVKLFFREP